MNSSLSITLGELLAEFKPKGVLSEVSGDSQVKISRIAPIENAKPGDLVFADKKKYLPLLQRSTPTAVVTTANLKNIFGEIPGLTVLISANVPLAHAIIKQKFDTRDYKATGWTGIHQTAVIHPTAKVGENTVIEPYVVIGARTKIGKNCRIQAGVVIENDVKIGDNAIIQPNAIIGYSCILGNDVQIGSGTEIGSEGYGFAQDSKRKSYTIPQTGNVVLEDQVRLGANCAIDRGTYGATKIGRGTKLDNLCHVAHNVQIGEDCLLTAMFCVAGSTKIGNRVMASGQSGIIDHMTIVDDVALVHRPGVVQDITEPGTYAGTPLQPLNKYLRNLAVYHELSDLQKKLRELEKKLEESVNSQS